MPEASRATARPASVDSRRDERGNPQMAARSLLRPRPLPARVGPDCHDAGVATDAGSDSQLDPGQAERLIAAGRSLVSELNLEQLLTQLLDVARELTGARYAAIGVLDEEAQRARALPHARDRRRDPPRDRRSAARPRDPRPADRRAPAAAPARPARAPALLRLPRQPPADAHVPRRADRASAGDAWGNLYLTDKENGEDFDGDRRSSRPGVVLADWAAVAIENASLYHRADRVAATSSSAPSTASRRRPRSPAPSAPRPRSTACSS